MVIAQSNINPAIQFAASTFRHHHRLHFPHHRFLFPRPAAFRRLTIEVVNVRAFSTNEAQSAEIEKLPNKPPICTADELHYVTVNNSDWRLALWRYKPSPQADPAQALNVPVVPLGALLSAAYPLSSRPPYVLSWLNDLISAQDMMHPELLKKLVLNNFCTIPAKLLLQLTTAFREGGLRDRSGTFFYKDHLHKSNVPVLALAGDRDLICPPEAVYGYGTNIPMYNRISKLS
ncbi:UNVERIFIED_CONTAM: hypothetical protein Sradi_1824600 [Sesamum radiatum]|uniref:Uncharacterized protein n=1 Tax=Sesamum radiatum TaxID=300843 RepID=A0AAW2TWI9_SESRA